MCLSLTESMTLVTGFFTLYLKEVKECLKELQEKYLFVPADKAANNIIVVCKRYYLEVRAWSVFGHYK